MNYLSCVSKIQWRTDRQKDSITKQSAFSGLLKRTQNLSKTLIKIPKHNFNKNHCRGARASDRIANLLSLPLTKAGFGLQQAWGTLQRHIHAAYIAREWLWHLHFSSPNQVPRALSTALLQGLAVVWVTQGSTADSAVPSTHRRGGQCCGQAPRPLSVLAEMRVRSCSYRGGNLSKNHLGTCMVFTFSKQRET